MILNFPFHELGFWRLEFLVIHIVVERRWGSGPENWWTLSKEKSFGWKFGVGNLWTAPNYTAKTSDTTKKEVVTRTRSNDVSCNFCVYLYVSLWHGIVPIGLLYLPFGPFYWPGGCFWMFWLSYCRKVDLMRGWHRLTLPWHSCPSWRYTRLH